MPKPQKQKRFGFVGQAEVGGRIGDFRTMALHICLTFSIDICIARSEMLLIDHVLFLLLCAPMCPQTAEEKQKQVNLLVVICARGIQLSTVARVFVCMVFLRRTFALDRFPNAEFR